MRFYFAGLECKQYSDIVEGVGDNILFSYFYLKFQKDYREQLMNLRRKFPRVFCDSGAFTAMTKGEGIDVMKYIDFLLENKDLVDVYAVLDVICDFEGTLKNQRLMESAGLKPLWVFHRHEPYEMFREVSSHYDYIAVGGIAGMKASKKDLYSHLDRVFSLAKRGTRIHGFGIHDVDVLLRYPFYSCDSTMWLDGSKWNVVFTMDGIKKRRVKVSRKDKYSHEEVRIFSDGKMWKNKNRQNVRYFAEMESFLTKVWEKRGVKWHD